MKSIDFWFSIGSTYTYLTVMRLNEVAQREGVQFNWQPFSVRALMQEMDNKPFIGKPIKTKYMWRDIERRAARYKIPVNVPADYPLKHFDLANRIAIVAKDEGWCEDYVRSSYIQWFQHGVPAGETENIEDALKSAGQSVNRVMDNANSSSTGAAYEAATSEARELGIFGSPTFVVSGKELFWGDDRLEDALEYQNS